MKKKALYMILILFFTGIFALGTCQLYRQLREYDEGDSLYTDIEQYVWIEDEPENDSDGQENESRSGESEINWPTVDFTALAEINPDIVAWIYIVGTEINYPVVQGTDNQYYLKHLFNGEWNGSGCIFLDSRNTSDFSDLHSIIYGHHMNDGTMFSNLVEYKNQAFYDEHPSILLITPEKKIKINIFSGYVTNVEDDAWNIDFDSNTAFEKWINLSKERSYFDSKINPSSSDKIITLSTCSYEFNNARFVLCGIAMSY